MFFICFPVWLGVSERIDNPIQWELYWKSQKSSNNSTNKNRMKKQSSNNSSLLMLNCSREIPLQISENMLRRQTLTFACVFGHQRGRNSIRIYIRREMNEEAGGDRTEFETQLHLLASLRPCVKQLIFLGNSLLRVFLRTEESYSVLVSTTGSPEMTALTSLQGAETGCVR